MWVRRGKPFSIHQQPWLVFDPEKTRQATVEIVLQYNGKVRDRIEVPVDLPQEKAEVIALQNEKIRRSLGARAPKQVIYMRGRLINVVG